MGGLVLWSLELGGWEVGTPIYFLLENQFHDEPTNLGL